MNKPKEENKMETVNKKTEPYIFISVDEWKRQLEKNNAYIIEETGEHFIMGWKPKTCSNFGQTVKIHNFLRVPYMKPKIIKQQGVVNKQQSNKNNA